MSGAEHFKAAVPERSVPTDWRGGLERERRKAGRVGCLNGCGWTSISHPQRGERGRM